MNKYIEKELKKLERSANRLGRLHWWYENYLLIIIVVSSVISGIIGAIIGVVIGFSITGR